jgi:hypothetical protein
MESIDPEPAIPGIRRLLGPTEQLGRVERMVGRGRRTEP